MPVTILVVEDDEELNDVMQYNLSKAGYRVLQEWDGKIAMETIAREHPDLILLDIMLPGADGWQVCEFLQQSPDLKDIPVIFFTAKSGWDDFDRAREYNMAGFFTKPYGNADVLRHIEKVVTNLIDAPAA